MLMALVNSVAVLAALGAVLYTKVLFKRPEITEHGERAAISAKVKEPKAEETKGFVTLEPMTVTIQPGQGADQGVQDAKLHYATVTFVLEIRNAAEQAKFEAIKQVFMDQTLHMLSKKRFEELTSIQGRHTLMAEMTDTANALIKEPLVTRIFYTQFIVQ